MQTIQLKDDLKVFGFQVNTFPNGISEAFDVLLKTTGDGFGRSYYAIAFMSNEGPVYRATALEKYDGEGTHYSYEQYTIEKGQYLSITVHDWQQKTHTIKGVFDKLLQHDRVDHTKPCVEWYRNENEMLCMVKIKPSKQ